MERFDCISFSVVGLHLFHSGSDCKYLLIFVLVA